MQGVKLYTIDLTKIKGKGDFKCPKCGVRISPDDESDSSYTILETVMEGDVLEKVTLECNRCHSHIHLTGFNLLNKVGQT